MNPCGLLTGRSSKTKNQAADAWARTCNGLWRQTHKVILEILFLWDDLWESLGEGWGRHDVGRGFFFVGGFGSKCITTIWGDMMILHRCDTQYCDPCDGSNNEDADSCWFLISILVSVWVNMLINIMIMMLSNDSYLVVNDLWQEAAEARCRSCIKERRGWRLTKDLFRNLGQFQHIEVYLDPWVTLDNPQSLDASEIRTFRMIWWLQLPIVFLDVWM